MEKFPDMNTEDLRLKKKKKTTKGLPEYQERESHYSHVPVECWSFMEK